MVQVDVWLGNIYLNEWAITMICNTETVTLKIQYPRGYLPEAVRLQRKGSRLFISER